MNNTIWKFELETIDNQTIKIPVGGEILTIQTQNGMPCLWALVDSNADKEDRFIEIYGTGHFIRQDENVNRKYIGTYQLGGSLVFHVFEHLIK